MAQMAAVTLRGQYRRIDPSRSSVVLIEGGPRILPSFAERLATKAARRLDKLGVTVTTGTPEQLAARFREHAAPGQVLVSEQARNRLDDQIGVTEHAVEVTLPGRDAVPSYPLSSPA